MEGEASNQQAVTVVKRIARAEPQQWGEAATQRSAFPKRVNKVLRAELCAELREG